MSTDWEIFVKLFWHKSRKCVVPRTEGEIDALLKIGEDRTRAILKKLCEAGMAFASKHTDGHTTIYEPTNVAKNELMRRMSQAA